MAITFHLICQKRKRRDTELGQYAVWQVGSITPNLKNMTDPTSTMSLSQNRAIKRTALVAGGGALAMLGLAFAADPLYDTFCRVTGFGGTTQIANAAPKAVLDRQITVRFDANTQDSALVFRPLQIDQKVQLGAHNVAFYEVTNPTDDIITAVASYNVTPHKGGPFFNKLECFCFEDRQFPPGETRRLPVVYFVDPDLDTDRNASELTYITLSYTFFEKDE